jgi:FkbM family methyltransferase
MDIELDYNIINNLKINYYKNDQEIGKCIKNGYIYGEDIYNIIKLNRIKNKDILDIGGFIGTVSLLSYDLIKDEKDSKIHVFEPRYHFCLEKNIDENNMNNKIILHKIGLSNYNAFIDDHLNNNPDMKNLGGQEIFKSHDGTKKLELSEFIKNKKNLKHYFELKRLDDLNFNNIGFIKIDVESMEIYVIKGALDTLKKNNYPPLLIELLGTPTEYHDPSKCLYDTHSNEVYNLLINLGYSCNKKFINGKSDDFLFLYNH